MTEPAPPLPPCGCEPWCQQPCRGDCGCESCSAAFDSWDGFGRVSYGDAAAV